MNVAFILVVKSVMEGSLFLIMRWLCILIIVFHEEDVFVRRMHVDYNIIKL